MSVQPAKPASPIRLLCEQLPNVYVFSAHEIFTTFCVLFPNRISYFKILAVLSVYVIVLCVLLIADTNLRVPCVFRSLEVGNTFLIFSYFQAKYCLSCGAISHSDAVFF